MVNKSFCLSHPRYRLLTLIRSRIKALNFAVEAYKPHSYTEFRAQVCALQRLSVLLDNDNVISPDQLALIKTQWTQYPKTNKEHINQLFIVHGTKRSTNCHPTFRSSVIEVLRKNAKYARVSELKWRITSELREKAKAGYYVVFNTLTVRPDAINKVFADGSKEWRKYVGEVTRSVISSCGSGVSAAVDDLHTYFCVVERGGKTGRLHIHVIHMVKALPKGSVDPNYGARIPYKRVIDRWREFWPHGHSTPIAVRFSSSDAYGKDGWQWPCRDKDGKERIVAKPPEALAAYMSKYLVKAYEQEKSEEVRWRTRMSRNLGKRVIQNGMKKMSCVELRKGPMKVLGSRDMVISGRGTPSQLVKSEATKMWMKKWKKSQSMWRLLRGLEAQGTLIEQLDSLMKERPERNSKMQRCGNIVTENMKSMAISKVHDAQKEMFGPEAKKWNVTGPDGVSI